MQNMIINQLKNLFAAMPFAEAGDLDTVKQILRENPCTAAAAEESTKTTAQPPVIPAF